MNSKVFIEKIKYECEADNKVSFLCNAMYDKVLSMPGKLLLKVKPQQYSTWAFVLLVGQCKLISPEYTYRDSSPCFLFRLSFYKSMKDETCCRHDIAVRRHIHKTENISGTFLQFFTLENKTKFSFLISLTVHQKVRNIYSRFADYVYNTFCVEILHWYGAKRHHSVNDFTFWIDKTFL